MFSLPRDVCVTALGGALAPANRLLVQRPVRMRREWLDTFDWRLFAAGLVLEYQRDAGGGRLLLFGSGDQPLELSASGSPRFLADLPTAVLRRRLAGVLDVRALLPRHAVSGALHELRLLDARGKTVTRVQLWRPARRGPCFARVLRLRGFEASASKAAQRLAAVPGAVRLEADPLQSAAAGLASPPGRHPGWKAPVLEPAMRTDEAMLLLLRHYHGIMELNIRGMVEDLDPEFLHDFRVALRRSRSLLSGVKGVFAPARLQPFIESLRWLSRVTGPPRDADVHALEFPAYIDTLSAVDAHALDPLMAYVAQERVDAHRELVKALESALFRRRWAAWGRFLKTKPPRASRQPRGPRPVQDSAVEVTGKAARRVRLEGGRIDAGSAAEEYHKLRVSGKKLRYLIDGMGNCLPIKNLHKVTRRLKKLQDVLGEHQDLDVHRSAILDLYRELAERGELAGETHLAMEHLLDELARRAAVARGHFEHEFRRFVAVRLDQRLRKGKR